MRSTRATISRADELGAESLRLWRVLGEEIEINRLVYHQGRLAFHRKDFAEATELFFESLSSSRLLGNAHVVVDALAMLGRVHGEMGRLDEATAYLQEALSAAQELGDKGYTAFVLYGLAHVEKARGDHDEARRLFSKASVFTRKSANVWEQGNASKVWRPFVARPSLAFEGTLLLAAAEALRASLGVPLSTPLIDEHARSVAAARAALGEASFADVWAMGRVMSAEQAAAEVLASAA